MKTIDSFRSIFLASFLMIIFFGILGIERQIAYGDFFSDLGKMFGSSLPGFSTYTDPSGKITFQYPSEWIKIMETNFNNLGISFGSPIQADNSGRVIFSLSTESLNGISFEDYKIKQINNLKQTNIFGRGVVWIEGPIDKTVSNLPAYEIKFISPLLGGLDTLELITMKDDKIYTISYQGKHDNFQKYFDDFNKIVGTVKI